MPRGCLGAAAVQGRHVVGPATAWAAGAVQRVSSRARLRRWCGAATAVRRGQLRDWRAASLLHVSAWQVPALRRAERLQRMPAFPCVPTRLQRAPAGVVQSRDLCRRKLHSHRGMPPLPAGVRVSRRCSTAQCVQAGNVYRRSEQQPLRELLDRAVPERIRADGLSTMRGWKALIL